ncbi:MAG: FAD-dependent oxidoreductase, partial [Rhizobiaceae bacterium]|nr:FAD-dependent oxidoreductase [Rhizobiaceae bacterium]
MSCILDIGIIGAGPAGLCAAIYLRRQGKKVTVYEQFEEAKPVGSGLRRQPTG